MDFEEGVFKDNGMLTPVCDTDGKILMAIQVIKPKPYLASHKKYGQLRTFLKTD